MEILDLDMAEQFFFEMGEEVFGGGIVQAVASAGHGRADPQVSDLGLISRGAVLETLIAVQHQALAGRRMACGRSQRLEDHANRAGWCHQKSP